MGGCDHVTLQQQGLDSVAAAVPLHGYDVTTLHYKKNLQAISNSVFLVGYTKDRYEEWQRDITRFHRYSKLH